MARVVRAEPRAPATPAGAQTFSAADAAREVSLAEPRIRPHIRETPLEPSAWLSRELGAEVYLKLESAQVTGSFKARGALNKLLALGEADRARGVVAASTGNHALAVAHALAQLGMDGEIFLPSSVSPAKLEALQLRKARVRLIDEDPGLVETIARREAEASGRVYVSPYNDPQVIGGQGTIAVELLRQLPQVSAVVVPVGGGGLISGIASFLKRRQPAIRVIGCQPAACAIMARSVEEGRLLELASGPSLSDATVGLLEPGAITFPLCRELVDEWVVVDEPAIRSGLRLALERHFVLIEGASALPVAALLAVRERFRGAQVALVLSGSHLALPALAEMLREA
jgi:threonine dehydratase